MHSLRFYQYLRLATDARIYIKRFIKKYSCISGYTLLCIILPANTLIRYEILDAIIIYWIKKYLRRIEYSFNKKWESKNDELVATPQKNI